MAYCTKDDLLTGDIPLAGKYGDGTAFVNLAADEIDSQIGHIYITPVVFDVGDPEDPIKVAKARPARLLLKKINTLLASGRIILDMAAGGEDDRLHAYGRSMVNEALSLLNKITNMDIILVGAEMLPDAADDQNTGPSVLQEDPYSLVRGFYDRYSSGAIVSPMPMRPYADEPLFEMEETP